MVFYAVFIMLQNTGKYWNNLEIGLKREELKNENEAGIRARTFFVCLFSTWRSYAYGDG